MPPSSSNPVFASTYFHLGKSQGELDFVDVPIYTDIPLFIDPFAISLRPDRWSQACAVNIQHFFQQVIDFIRAGKHVAAQRLLNSLGEPNETHLGLSRGRPQGAGIGRYQASQLYDALADSAAVQSGFLSHLEESELMIPGIGRDKISDLATNIIRRELADYTKDQCELLNIPLTQSPLPPYFDGNANRWVSDYFPLPQTPRGPLVFVPKVIVRYDLAYEHHQFYRDFVLEYLRAEELQGGSSLVHTLQDGSKQVYLKDLKAKYPLTKEFLYRFSKDRPDVLRDYRTQLEQIEKTLDTPVRDDDEPAIAELLTAALNRIPKGGTHASDYHSLMIGIMEFLLFPQLLHPVKEKEIHEGRKRIDILMENGARAGTAFHDLHHIKKLPAAYVAIECKNYTTEVSNPELDQLAGRFSVYRGKFGILCCRSFENRNLFIKRCRDTLKDDRGLIIPFDDNTVIELLALVVDKKRSTIDRKLRELITEVWV